MQSNWEGFSVTSFATQEDARRLGRWTGWAGIVFVLLIIPAIVLEVRGPDWTTTPTKIAATFASARTEVLVSSALLIGALTAFFVFATGVAEIARRHDRIGLLSSLSRSSAAIGVAILTVYTAIYASLAASIDQLQNPQVVYAIFRAATAIDSTQDLFLGLFILTSALPLARAGIVGRWFTGFALLTGSIYAIGCLSITSATEGAFMHFEVIGTVLLIVWAAILSIRLLKEQNIRP